MIVYAIVQDGWKFKQFGMDQDLYVDVYENSLPKDRPENYGYSYHELLDFGTHNLSVIDWWIKVSARYTASRRIAEEKILIPDIAEWIYGTIVLSRKAKNALAPLIEGFGELLPVEVDGNEFYIFNCLTFAEHDQLKAKREKVNVDGEERAKLSFNMADVKNKPIFKTKTKISDVNLFCNEDFKQSVEKAGLTGINFNINLQSIFCCQHRALSERLVFGGTIKQ